VGVSDQAGDPRIGRLSWRDSVSQSAQDDLDRLLGEALPFAQKMLAKNGEFFPYAIALAADGTARMVAAYEGSENPPSSELLTMLFDGLRRQSSELRGAAIVSDVRIKDPDSDAIRVEVEHIEGAAMAVVLPYRIQKKLLGRDVTYGEMRALSAERRIWPGPATS
jgi:hypothetical protein